MIGGNAPTGSTIADVLRRSSHSILAVPVAIWLVSTLGLLHSLSWPLYDALMSVSAQLEGTVPSVLLVEAEADRATTPEEYVDAVRILQELGARSLAFAFLPAAPDAFYAEAAERGVVFGWPVEPDPDEPDEVRLSPRPGGAAPPELAYGALEAPLTDRGVARRLRLEIPVAGRRHPSFEVVAARRAGARHEEAPAGEVLIRFFGGRGSLPHVTLEAVLSKRLVPELVSGRAVLIGRSYQTQPGIDTPTTSAGQAMTSLELRGQALGTLLQGRPLIATGPLGSAVLLLLPLTTLVLYHRSGPRLAPWITAAALAVWAALGVAGFFWGGLYLPVVELCLVQVGLLFFALREKATLTNALSRRLVAQLRLRARDGSAGPRSHADPEHWAQVVAMLNQTLELTRVIFLERVEGDHRVREVRAMGCALSDIAERRRDYLRTPYSTAIETRRPVRTGNFFEQARGDDEVQYLVPLVFAGEPLGFWALGVERAQLAAIPDFEQLTRGFGEQIAELLYHRQRSIEEAGASGVVADYLRPRREIDLLTSLRRMVALVELRLGRLQSLVDDLNSAAVLYDVFGRLLEVNRRMREAFEREGIAPFDSTLLDSLSALTGYDVEHCRRLVRRVVLEKQDVSLPVALSDGRSYALLLRPLACRPTEALGADRDPAPFALAGILCELVDTTSQSQLYEMKSHLMERLGVHLRNDLAALELSSSLLARGLPARDVAEVSEIVHTKVAAAVATIAECESYVRVESGATGSERFPINPQGPLRDAAEACSAVLAERGLRLDMHQPRMLSYVLASPAELTRIFSELMELLASDAVAGTALTIEVEESVEQVRFRFWNRGYGMPDEQFQAHLGAEPGGDGGTLRELQAALAWLERWGGDYEARSEVGVGTQMSIRLPKFK